MENLIYFHHENRWVITNTFLVKRSTIILIFKRRFINDFHNSHNRRTVIWKSLLVYFTTNVDTDLRDIRIVMQKYLYYECRTRCSCIFLHTFKRWVINFICVSFVSRNRRELDRNRVGGKNNEMIDFQIYRAIIMAGRNKKNSERVRIVAARGSPTFFNQKTNPLSRKGG